MSLKKCIALFVMLLVISIFTKVNAETKPHFYIGEAVKYENAENVSVDILLENPNEKMATLSLRLGYDSNQLEYVNAKAGKDLNATMKLAEKVENEDEIAIGALSLTGFSKGGTYYTVNFKVKDEKAKEIPITLKVKEATDGDGNNIECETSNGVIKVTNKTLKNVEQNSKIESVPSFEINEIQEFQTMEEIISNNTDIEFSSSDILEYESSDATIVEFSEDGTIFPKNDGTANVKVKLNDNQISEMEIQIENGKVTKMKTLDNIAKESENYKKEITDNQEQVKIEADKYFQEDKNTMLSNTQVEIKEKNNIAIYIIIAVVILVIIISFIIIKKRGGNK